MKKKEKKIVRQGKLLCLFCQQRGWLLVFNQKKKRWMCKDCDSKVM